MPFSEFLFVTTVAASTAVVALGIISRVPKKASAADDKNARPAKLSMLFKGTVLEHATPYAQSLLIERSGNSDWQTLRTGLKSRFPDMPQLPADLTEEPLTLHAADPDDSATLSFNREGPMTTVEICDNEAADPSDRYRLRSLEFEVDKLSQATSTAPHPIWLVSTDGEVVWYNPAYAQIYWRVHETEPVPDRPLFDPRQIARPGLRVRSSVQTVEKDETLWYDLSAVEVEGGLMFHAVDIGATIQAEIAQRNFVQTLAKTFAQLSTGLAIFDRKGQLALFNPALVDLTRLSAEFLSARPTLLTFFDRLRDNRIMPEPKDYASWRQEFSDLIVAASDGHYQDTWALDDGLTYRVNGRPHPDGAVAFLFEDITAEVSLTRKFRTELQLGQALMDSFDDGLVVFSSAGVLTFCNAAYRHIWKLDPEKCFADVTILDSIRAWQAQSLPDPAWGDIRDFVMRLGDRSGWETRIEHSEGRAYLAHVTPIASGATLIRFEAVTESVMRDEIHGTGQPV